VQNFFTELAVVRRINEVEQKLLNFADFIQQYRFLFSTDGCLSQRKAFWCK